MAGFKPKQTNPSAGSGGGSNRPKKEFVTAVPEEDGLRPVAVSMILSLGDQIRPPYNETDKQGNEIVDEDGNKVVKHPKPCQQIAMYVDLLNDDWDYGDGIGVKQLRKELHDEWAGNIVRGLNFIEVGSYTPEGEYQKGIPWTLPPASMFAKIAKACKAPEVMEAGDYGENENEYKSDITRFLGKPFMMNAEISRTPKKDGDGEWVDLRLKTPVPLMKGLPCRDLEAKPLFLTFDSEVEEIVENMMFIRANARRKIMKALNYSNINYGEEGEPVVPSNFKIAFEQCGVNKYGYINDEDESAPEQEQEQAPEAPEEAPKAAKAETKPKPKPKAATKPKPVPEPLPDGLDDEPPF
ncbi:hypothetical protein N9937_00365 [bacterium]|nr:hypothetical protein [bacterium]